MKPFSEHSTLTDIEIDSIIAVLRAELEKKRPGTGLISINRHRWPRGEIEGQSYWSIAVVYGNYGIAATNKLLHEALNDLVDKVQPEPDLAAILGLA